MNEDDPTDWSGCAMVERVPGKVSGGWLLKDTRLPVAAILDNFDAGEPAQDIAGLFEVPRETVQAVLAHAPRLRAPHPVR